MNMSLIPCTLRSVGQQTLGELFNACSTMTMILQNKNEWRIAVRVKTQYNRKSEPTEKKEKPNRIL